MSMSVEELSGFLGREIGELKDASKQMAAQVGELSTAVAGLTATLDATAERHASEIGELFRRTNDHNTRIGNVERDYTPRENHDAVERRVQIVEQAVAGGRVMLTGAHAIITLLGMGGVAAIMRYFGGHG